MAIPTITAARFAAMAFFRAEPAARGLHVIATDPGSYEYPQVWVITPGPSRGIVPTARRLHAATSTDLREAGLAS